MPSAGSDYAMLPSSSGKSKADLIKVMDAHVVRETIRFTPEWTLMAIGHYYMRGIRNFIGIDRLSGSVRWSYNPQQDGKFMDFIYHDMVVKKDQVVGQLQQFDVSPHVKTDLVGLSMVRQKNAAQVLLDSSLDPKHLETVKYQINNMLTDYGSVGLMSHTIQDPVMGPRLELEAVAPWEILPFPGITMDPSKQRGYVRRRLVDLEFLKKRYPGKAAANEAKMDGWRVPYGSDTSSIGTSFTGDIATHGAHVVRPPMIGSRSGVVANKPGSDRYMPGQTLIMFEEWFLLGSQGNVIRYIARSGEWIAEDEDYSQRPAPCALEFRRYMDNGSFYGIGIPGLLMHINRNNEQMLFRVFEHIRSMDKFGTLVIPSGQFDAAKQFKETPYGLLVCTWEPEQWNSNLRPFKMDPHTPGRDAASIVALGQSVADNLVKVPEVLMGDAPGRVDSHAALQFAADKASNTFHNPTTSVGQLFGNAYRYGVFALSRAYVDAGSERLSRIPVTKLHHTMIGTAIDAPAPDSDGVATLRLTSELVPDYNLLQFGVRGDGIRMKLAEGQKIIEGLSRGYTTLDEAIMLNAMKGLDLPFYRPEWEQTIRSTTLNILLLFNDGIEPGQMFDNPDFGVTTCKLMLLQEVMAMPEFALASEEVKVEFQGWLDDLRNDTGAAQGSAVAAGFPPLDELAAAANMQAQAAKAQR
jgi:hypothetical protein